MKVKIKNLKALPTECLSFKKSLTHLRETIGIEPRKQKSDPCDT